MASAAAPEPPATAAPPEAVCIICLDRGDEPLHRNCACRGPTAGFAHMSCLIRAAANKPELWTECGVCNENYCGATQLGLARARWERARGLPKDDNERLDAMSYLATALTDAETLHADSGDFAKSAALPLYEIVLAADRRMLGSLHANTLASTSNLAQLHVNMGNPRLAQPLAEECLRGHLNLLRNRRSRPSSF